MPYFTYNSNLIFYRKSGHGKPVIILPGNTASSKAHTKEIEYFSKTYCTISMDFLGTGESNRIDQWETDWWLGCADQVNQLIRHLNLKDVNLIGTSGGATIALLTAALYAEKINKVIADSSFEKISDQLIGDTMIRERQEKSDSQKQFWQYCHGDDWELVVNQDTNMLLEFVRNDGDWFHGKLKKIHCPVLLTGSRQDIYLPNIFEQFQSMSQQIVDCSCYISSKGGHPLIWTASEIFLKIASDFLKE